MPTYLLDLTLKLAEGVAQLPADCRQRHVRFTLGRQQPDGGFAGREGGSDLYYTGFALRTLAISGELCGQVAERAAQFLRQRAQGKETIVDFLSLLYGAMLLEQAAGIAVFADAPLDWPQRVTRTLEQFRRDDGGYAPTLEGYSSSTYYSFLVLLCQQLLESPTPAPEKLLAFAQSRQREDGGFVEQSAMQRSGTNPTAAGVGILTILDAVDEKCRAAAAEYLLDRQTEEGGLAANTRIAIPDILSTFTGTWTLHSLGALEQLDLQAARRFVQSLQLEGGGFLAGEFDHEADVEYTFYGLAALGLLSTV